MYICAASVRNVCRFIVHFLCCHCAIQLIIIICCKIVTICWCSASQSVNKTIFAFTFTFKLIRIKRSNSWHQSETWLHLSAMSWLKQNYIFKITSTSALATRYRFAQIGCFVLSSVKTRCIRDSSQTRITSSIYLITFNRWHRAAPRNRNETR